MILFGVGNMLGDVYDCCRALRTPVSTIVLNAPEVTRPRTKDFRTRLAELGESPLVVSLEDVSPRAGEEGFLVPTTPRRAVLVEELRRRFDLSFATLVHPTAYVSPYARVGRGVFIGARSVVAAGAVLADHVFVNRGVTVGHDTSVEPFARLQPGCNVGGHVRVGRGVTIGMGANVIEELDIGRYAVVAAGAAVTRDVAEGALVAGVPAVVKKVQEGPWES